MISKTALLLLLATVGYAKHHTNEVHAGEWPPIKHETTFKSSVSVFQYDGKKIAPFHGATGTLKVDASRNKAAVSAKVSVPFFGNVDADLVLDFTTGIATAHIPFLNICESANLGGSMQIGDVLNKAFDPNGGITNYIGSSSAPWDTQTPSFKFTSTQSHGGKSYSIDSYFEQSSKNPKWIHSLSTGFAVEMAHGMEPATFQDSDFVLTGCKAANTFVFASGQNSTEEAVEKHEHGHKYKRLRRAAWKALKETHKAQRSLFRALKRDHHHRRNSTEPAY